MTWFKVDDSLHAHVKAMRAGEAALGLWVLAGSWSASQLTDGWVPEYVARRFSPQADELAAALVAAGLWQEMERDGERGWVFHDWREYQPTRAEVEAQRDEARERMRRLRSSRRSARGRSVPTERPDSSAAPNAKPASKATDPQTDQKSSSSGIPKATRLPEDFAVTDEMVAWARVECPDVDGRYETAQFEDYWRSQAGPSAAKVDWQAVWRRWMRKAQKDLQQQCREQANGHQSRTDANIDAFLRDGSHAVSRALYALPGGDQ